MTPPQSPAGLPCLTLAVRHLLPGAPAVLQVAGARQADQVAALVARSHPYDLVVDGRVIVDDERALMCS